MIRLRGQLICVDADEASAVRSHAPAHISASRSEPGCLSFDIAPTDDPLVFEVIESFRTSADLKAHQVRTRASRWFAETRAILRDFRPEDLPD